MDADTGRQRPGQSPLWVIVGAQPVDHRLKTRMIVRAEVAGKERRDLLSTLGTGAIDEAWSFHFVGDCVQASLSRARRAVMDVDSDGRVVRVDHRAVEVPNDRLRQSPHVRPEEIELSAG